MTRTTQLSIADRADDRDMRERMGRLHVLVADRDMRTAMLVQKVLFSLGISGIEMASDGEQVLELLKTRPFDFMITEWRMPPFEELQLVKIIRAEREDKRIRRDLPIIMLTAKAEVESIRTARDAGVNEFVVKPFSAKALSGRIIQIIDNPRPFIESPNYTGPCRRRRGDPPPGVADRRVPRAKAAHVSPPDFRMLDTLGVDSAREAIDAHAISNAHTALMNAESEFVSWAQDDIRRLLTAFAALEAEPDNMQAQLALRDIAYAIQSQAGIFGYQMGTEVGGLLVHYVASHPFPSANHMRVIGKHIDTIRVVFNQKIEQNGREIALEVIASLKKLIAKLE